MPETKSGSASFITKDDGIRRTGSCKKSTETESSELLCSSNTNMERYEVISISCLNNASILIVLKMNFCYVHKNDSFCQILVLH